MATVDHCKSCNALIIWAQTTKGKAMPVDAVPDPDCGNVVLTPRDGRSPLATVYGKTSPPPAGALLRTAHFATCRQAAQHRRRNQTGRPRHAAR